MNQRWPTYVRLPELWCVTTMVCEILRLTIAATFSSHGMKCFCRAHLLASGRL